jgi:hypothetical protein
VLFVRFWQKDAFAKIIIMTRADLCRKILLGKWLLCVALVVLIGFSPDGVLCAQTPTLRDALLIDADGNSKTNAGDRLKYTLIFTNTTGGTLTNVLINFLSITNTTLASNSIAASPVARDEGPTATSVPGDAFHTPFNITLTVNDGDPAQDLLNNDFLGAPAAAITRFGGGSLGGTVDDNNVGATANGGGHSLTVNANGSFIYAPAIGFTGPFAFQYRLANTLGSNTATVTINVGARPSPGQDARIVTGNVQIDTSTGTAFSVLGNDLGDNVIINTITAGTLGAVNMSANGQFIYTPPRGKSSGTDTFTYTLSNGFGTSSPVTVELDFDGNIVWFIDVSAGAGDGRSHAPYNSLAAFNAVNDGGANNPADNQVILLRDGTYNNNVAGGALVLRNGQRVIGDGWSGTFLAATGFSPAIQSVPIVFSGTDPQIQNSTGNGIALASSNHVRGVTIGSTPNGFGFSGTAVGTPTIAESSKTGTGGAINITTSGAFGSSVNFDTLESSSSTSHNLSLTNVTGTLGITSGGTGLAGSAAGSAAVNINGGSVSLTYPGSVSKANGGSLVNVSGGHNTGTLTFNGAMNATAGDGLQFNNADGIYNFNTTVTLNGGDAGVDIVNGSSGNFSLSDTDITNPTGAAFLVSGGNGTISHAGTISKSNAGRLVDIQLRAGGSVTLTGDLSSTGASTGILCNGNTGGTITFSGAAKTLNTGANTAVSLTSNAGATINFSNGGLAITTTSGTGFNATGGAAAVTVTGAGNSIISGSGMPLNVVSTTIGGSGLTFQNIACNGGANGILLNNTGAGGLTITGVGTTAGSGGTIQNIQNRGASFINAANITLKNMNFTSACTVDNAEPEPAVSQGLNGNVNAVIHLSGVGNVFLDRLALSSSAQQGINGLNVTDFSMNQCTLANLGSGPDEDGLHFYNMLGTCGITNTTITSSGDDNVNIQNAAGVSTITVSGGSFNTGVLGSGLLFGPRITANTTIKILNVTCDNNFSGGVVADASDIATMNIEVSGAAILNNNDAIAISCASGNVTFDVHDNSNIGANDFVCISLLKAAFSTGGTMSGQIRNNTIVTANGKTADAVTVIQAGGGALQVSFTGNNFDYAGTQRAILLQAGQDGNGSLEAKATGNTFDIKLDGAGNAVAGVLAQSAITGPGSTSPLCLDIGGAGVLRNTFTHSLGGTMAAGDLRVRQRNSGTARLPGYAGGATDTAAVSTYLNSRNTVVSPTTATADSTGFAGGAACLTP